MGLLARRSQSASRSSSSRACIIVLYSPFWWSSLHGKPVRNDCVCTAFATLLLPAAMQCVGIGLSVAFAEQSCSGHPPDVASEFGGSSGVALPAFLHGIDTSSQ